MMYKVITEYYSILYSRAVQLYLLRAATASYHLVAGRNTGGALGMGMDRGILDANAGRLLDSAAIQHILYLV